MKDFDKKIDSIIDWLTEPDGGNAVTESDIREAIVELNELRKFNLLGLPVVSNNEVAVCDIVSIKHCYFSNKFGCDKCNAVRKQTDC